MDNRMRERWRQEIVSEEEWMQHTDLALPIQPGGAGGYLVRSAQSGLLGYMKPLNPNPNHPIAAYEKIASDLAYEAGANVPPVVLHRRPSPPTPQPKEVAISVVSGKSFVWGDVFTFADPKGGISQPGLAQLARQVLIKHCGVMAFDAWLSNHDRNNARNAILAYDSDDGPEMIYIDFGHTMDHCGQWTQGRHQVFERVGVPPFFAECVTKEKVRHTAERIVGLADDTVAEIVQRIPNDFLAGSARQQIIDWLLWRKRNLLPAWDQWYAGN